MSPENKSRMLDLLAHISPQALRVMKRLSLLPTGMFSGTLATFLLWTQNVLVGMPVNF